MTSEVAGSGGPWRDRVRPLGLELSQTVFDHPVGLTQSIVSGEPAFANQLVEGLKFFDFNAQFPELAVKVRFTPGELGNEAFDGGAGRRLHALFEVKERLSARKRW